MFSRVYTAQINVLEGSIVTVETDISRGLFAFQIVGLGDKSVEEARERVSSALKHSGFDSPRSKNQKITILLSPADQKKEGSFFDVAIALGYLLSNESLSFDPEGKLFIGELGLDGIIRPIRGILPIVQAAKRAGLTELYIPADNLSEAAIIDGVDIYSVRTLKELVDHLDPSKEFTLALSEHVPFNPSSRQLSVHMEDIRGQDSAKRGLEIAAAGRHNIALYGPPGTGKTMLARAFASILPELTLDEALEVTGIHSVAGTKTEGMVTAPPFRSPHHTASHVALTGGGAKIRPGEVTLAHRGVLFLDEFPEFDRRVLEALRQPIEDNVVSIARAKGSVLFPSNFILVAAFNPCPCGNFGSKEKQCTCTASEIERYKKKISGPIADRIDMWVSVSNFDIELLKEKGTGEHSDSIRERVIRARECQSERFNSKPHIRTNSDMSVRDMDEHIILSPESIKVLEDSARTLNLSPRGYHRVKKLARTIADLAGASSVEKEHILEALFFRPKHA